MTRRIAEKLPRRDYRTLDAVVVVAGLGLVAAFGWALVFRTIPEANLPILASLGTGVLGLIITYVNARWGNKKPTTDDDAGTVTVIPPTGTVTVEPPPAEDPPRA